MELQSVTSPLAALVLLASLPIVSGCSGRVAEAKPRATGEVVHVSSVDVKEEPVAKALRLTGSLEANRDSDVAAGTSGRVTATFVERGQYVKKGAILARLDAREASLATTQAKADADAARADARLRAVELGRTEKLIGARAIPEAELDRARSIQEAADQRVSAADARVALQARSVGDSIIRAPFDGIVAERWIDVGEYIRPESRVVTLVDIDTLRLKLTVPEAAALAVSAGQRVSFQVASEPGVLHDASVRFVGPQVRQASRDLVVEAVVENREHRLKPGMFATAGVEAGQESAFVIPREALKGSSGKSEGPNRRVFVIASGRLEERVVQVAETTGGSVIVRAGLRTGDKVVAPVTDNLRDGLTAR